MLECGGGWIAHWMDRLDEFLESYGWAAAPCRSRRASTSSGSAGSASTPVSARPVALAPLVGADRFIWASDFPHSDAKYPGVVDELREHNERHGPDDARRRCSGCNALDDVRHRDPSA